MQYCQSYKKKVLDGQRLDTEGFWEGNFFILLSQCLLCICLSLLLEEEFLIILFHFITLIRLVGLSTLKNHMHWRNSLLFSSPKWLQGKMLRPPPAGHLFSSTVCAWEHWAVFFQNGGQRWNSTLEIPLRPLYHSQKVSVEFPKEFYIED